MDRDIAVVGGSAAGLLTADILARAGRDVELFERNTQPDATPRTLIVTDRIRAVAGPAIESAVVNEINRFELFADGRVASIELSRPDLIVERAKVIQSLADDAAASGATITYGARFIGMAAAGRGIGVTLGVDHQRSHLEASVVVGADGSNSRVARAAGRPDQPTVRLVQAVVELPPDVPRDTSRVWFRPDDTPYFYWLVPESESRAALGVIGENGPEARRRLDRFLDEQGLTPLGYQAAVIPAYERWIRVSERLGMGKVYFVGDAAGQVKVSTVGGLVTGLRGAAAVAAAILNGGRDRELSRLKRELDLHRTIRRAMHGFTQDDYCFLLDQLSDPARRSLGGNDRDDASRILWSLCRSRPQLLLKGIRALVTRPSVET